MAPKHCCWAQQNLEGQHFSFSYGITKRIPTSCRTYHRDDVGDSVARVDDDPGEVPVPHLLLHPGGRQGQHGKERARQYGRERARQG